MTQRVTAIVFAVVVSASLGWTRDVRGDESPAQARSDDGVTIIADDTPAEAAEQQAKPQVKESLTKRQPISITFRFGDEDPSLTCNVIDDRPITAATTVGSVLSKAASATKIFRPADSIISVIRTKTTIGADSRVEVAEKSLRVEWDLVSNRPTEATNYKLLPGDRILVWQPAPLPGQGFVKLAPKAAPPAVWTPTIPPPPEVDPYRVAAVSYVTRQAATMPGPPTVMADPPGMLVGQQQPAETNVGAAVHSPTAALSSPPWPATATSGSPFFGQLLISPDPLKFREITEQVSLPNGQMHAVKRQVPTQPWMSFTIRFIADSSGSLEKFSPIEQTGQMVADSESLLGTLRILESNKLILPIDGKTGIGHELSPLITGGSRSEKMELDEATGEPRPGEVVDWRIDIMPTDLRGQLHVSIKLLYVLNGRSWEASPTAEIGRGQSLLTRLKPAADKAPGEAKRDDMRHYILLTPEVKPTPEPGPVPFAAQAD